MASRTASKIDWLKERYQQGDKYLNTPYGSVFLNWLAALVAMEPKIDPLLPWLVREAKKGRIETDYDGRPLNVDRQELAHWADWYGSNSPTRRGTDIMQMTLPDMLDKIQDWDEELGAKMDEEQQMHGTVVHDFSDPENPEHPWNGWTVRRVDNAEQASREGDAMGHCVGGYGREIENGSTGIFSLRDPKNQPHATVEIRPGEHGAEHYDLVDDHDAYNNKTLLRPEGGLVHQIQGKQNGQPDYEYQRMLRDWFGQVPGLGANVEKTTVPQPNDPDELQYWYEPDHGDNYGGYQLTPWEADEYGIGNDGDDFDYEGPPNWHNVIDSYLHREYPGYRDRARSPDYQPEHADQIKEIAHETGHQQQLDNAVAEHQNQLAQEFYNNVYDPKQYSGTAPVQWNSWHKGQKMNALMGTTGFDQTSLPYGPDGTTPLGGIRQPVEISPDQQKLFNENYNPQWNTWKDKPEVPVYEPWHQLSKTADYQGMSNWDTWNTKLMMDNDYELHQMQERMAREGWSPEQIRDWCIQHIIGPHNKDAIADAQEWNSIPEDERVDHNYEDFKDKHGDKPGAMDLIHGLVGGPDTSDSEPTLIDPELVNWHELHQSINDESADNEQYDRDQQALLDSGLDFGNVGSDAGYNQMKDALYKYHGAKPDSWFKQQGLSQHSGPGAQHAYHNINVTVPFEHFKNWTGYPDHYLPGGQDTARSKIWGLRYNKAYNAALANLQARHPDLDPEYLKEVAERSYRNHLPEGRKLDDNVHLEDPEERAILEADPLHQGWVQNGYTMRLHDFTGDMINDIQNGRPNPYTQQMQDALRQQGHAPEAIPQIMRQRWQWDPATQQRINLDPPTPEPPADPSLDQPGDLTLPEGWTASRRPSTSRWRSSPPGDDASRASSDRPEADRARKRNGRRGTGGSPASLRPPGSLDPSFRLSWAGTLPELEEQDQDRTNNQSPQAGVKKKERSDHGREASGLPIDPSPQTGPRLLMQPGEHRTCEHCLAPNRDAASSRCWSCGHRLLEPPPADPPPRMSASEATGGPWSLYQPNPDGSVRPHTENPYERYSPNWSQWLNEREQHAWQQSPGTLNTTYKDQHEWVPTEYLRPMLEWDRNVHGDPSRVQRLHDSLNQEGFKEPVWLDFNPKTEMAHVAEGNHKLTAALQHGIPSVPVMVYRSGRERPEISLHHKYIGPERDHLGEPRPPQYMSPSEIGIPTTEPTPPWRVAEDPTVGQVPPASASQAEPAADAPRSASTR